MLTEYFEPVVEDFQVHIERDQAMETADQGGLRLATACSVVYILRKYEIKLPVDKMRSIFRALLLHADKDMGICMDYQQMSEVYFVEESWKKSVDIDANSYLHISLFL